MEQNDNYEFMNEEDLNLLVKWCNYSHDLKKIIENTKFSNQTEYYCIDSNWFDNFKKFFSYDKLKFIIMKFIRNNKNALPNELITNLYSDLLQQNRILIPKNGKNNIKNIDNSHIYKDIQNPLFKNKYKINFYYDNFILVNKDILNEFKNRQYIIKEEPKCNFSIGKGFFIQSISNEVIEIGFFAKKGKLPDIYNYELLLLIKYEDKNDKDLEVGKIKGIKDYLYIHYNINEIKEKNLQSKIITKENEKKIIIINIKFINSEELNAIEDIKENKYDISKKIGLENVDNTSSGMNSIIQILTSIEDLRNYLLEEKISKNIESFNHIYIFSSYLLKFIYKLYSHNKDKHKSIYNNLERQMKIIINFINPEINNKSIDQYFLFFLNTLHDELNQSELKKTTKIELESFPSPLNTDKNFSYSKFVSYYEQYFQSKIAELFNWTSEKKNTCSHCNTVFFNYQAFPFLEFDLDKVHEYINTNNTQFKQMIESYQGNPALISQKTKEFLYEKQNQPIHIENCFSYLSNFNNINNFQCLNCKKLIQYTINTFIYKSPKYFIIVLNRNQPIRCQFDVALDLQNYADDSCEYKKYELMAVLVNQKNNSNNHYFTFIKKDENEWMKFDDNNVSKINTRDVLKKYQLESRILVYKGVKNN